MELPSHGYIAARLQSYFQKFNKPLPEQFCANASDGIMTAHPYGYKDKHLQEILGKKGKPFGQEIMEKATEGEVKEVSYWWLRPGSDEQVKKTSYYTKVGDQICGVGYYQD